MKMQTAGEPLIERRISDSWSIVIPAAFRETEDDEQAYWHGEDERRSVSTTSLLVLGPGGPVPALLAQEALQSMTAAISGATPFPELPPGLLGWAVTSPALSDAVARTMLSGVVVVDGQALLVTITADDLEWMRQTWRTVRFHPEASSWAH